MTPDIIAALEAFAAYADPRRSVPASMPVTSGSSMARKQLTMGDCYAAADALAALSTSPAGQEVRAPWIEAKELEALVAILDNPPAKALRSELVAAMLKAGQVIRDQSAALSPSVEPAGNGREAVENAFIAGWEAQKAGRSFAAAMNDHIPALSSPPAADQEAVKCKRCNDTGWTIGNGTVREGCLSCDAQINMVRATPPAPASSGEGDELRHKLWMVISHASGGHLSKEDDSDRSINDICVEISRHHNRIWEQALEKGRQEATTSTERGR